eukprot:CAMPEP_0117740088 /NCGR_PEP_ID=MMETSP0947-20121206/4139_1 /TAXON_ID=44440 /ORGANISM="Chattonella subsalsa, Strain CCMP2191" /LENGTH=1058 /DNA_ID=CAMNT_0005556147 /DNA_START=142 /DNA_END=3318 /DNA_ORIENTATION=+
MPIEDKSTLNGPSEASSQQALTKTAAEEKSLIQATQNTYGQTLGEVGETWYVLSSKWWRAWCSYSGYNPFNLATGTGTSIGYRGEGGGPRPGPITNEDLLVKIDPAEGQETQEGQEVQVRRTAMERYDYQVLPPQTWELLHSWYGGVPIARKIIETGLNKIVEVKYYIFSVTLSEDRSKSKTLYISRVATVGEFKKEAAKLWGVDPDERKLWDMMSGTKFAELDNDSLTITEARLMDDQEVMLEDKSAIAEADTANSDDWYSGGTSGRVYYGNGTSSYLGSSTHWTDTVTGGSPSAPGVVGLSNLGNTCFMNSALQCLSNTLPLCKYFVDDAYANEINRDNPLGTKGELVEAYASLVKALWGNEGRVVTPRNFKYTLGRFAEQFMGYEQHDSQELIAYLLDMIHEDVNRILQKPFVEKVEANAQEDDESASKRAWDAHLLRNDSVVVDTFQGQYKSVVTCPDCDKVSVTFDPFMYLTLPLPFSTEKTLPITFVPGDGTSLRKYVVKLPKTSTILALKKMVAARAGCDAADLQICDMWEGKVYETLKDSKSVDTIMDSDVTYAYLLPTTEVGGEGEQELKVGQWAETLKSFLKDSEDLDEVLKDTATMIERTRLLHRLKRIDTRCWNADEYELSGLLFQSRQFIKGIEDKESLMEFSEALKQFSDWVGDQAGRVLIKVMNQKQSMTTNYYYSSNTGYYRSFGNPFLTAYYPARTTVGQFKRDIARKMLRVLARNRESESLVLSEEEEIQSALQVLDTKLSIVVLRDKTDTGRVSEIFNPGEEPDGDVSPRDINEELLEDHIMGHTTLAIRWGKEELDEFYDEDRAGTVEQEEQGQNKRKKDVLTVYDCLAQFLKREQLEETEMWYCSKCKEHRRAWKQFFLWRTPPILVVHLKRFGSDGHGFREKLETFIEYPVNGLDFSQYCLDASQPPAVYDLYAVSNHYGGMGGGHYTAYAKNKNTGKWYDFDDSCVQEIDESGVVTEAGYVLFYMRKDLAIQSYGGGLQTQVQMSSDDATHQNHSSSTEPMTNHETADDDLSDDEALHQDAVVSPLSGISLRNQH